MFNSVLASRLVVSWLFMPMREMFSNSDMEFEGIQLFDAFDNLI